MAEKAKSKDFLDLSEKDREWAESEEWEVRGNNRYVYCVCDELGEQTTQDAR